MISDQSLETRRWIVIATAVVVCASVFSWARPWFLASPPNRSRAFLSNLPPTGSLRDAGPSATPSPWKLEQLGGSTCEWIAESDGLRVAFSTYLPGPAWQTLIYRDVGGLREGRHYRLRFEARSERPRSIEVSVRDCCDIGTQLGLHLRVELAPDWAQVELPFVADRSADRACARFDIGREKPALELRRVELVVDEQP